MHSIRLIPVCAHQSMNHNMIFVKFKEPCILNNYV